MAPAPSTRPSVCLSVCKAVTSPPLEAWELQLQAREGEKFREGSGERLRVCRPWNHGPGTSGATLSQRCVDKGLSQGPDLAMEREAPRPAGSSALSRDPLCSFRHFLVLSSQGGSAGALGEVLPDQQEAGEKGGEVFLDLFALPPPPRVWSLSSRE